jgi:hypothetical protein
MSCRVLTSSEGSRSPFATTILVLHLPAVSMLADVVADPQGDVGGLGGDRFNSVGGLVVLLVPLVVNIYGAGTGPLRTAHAPAPSTRAGLDPTGLPRLDHDGRVQSFREPTPHVRRSRLGYVVRRSFCHARPEHAWDRYPRRGEPPRSDGGRRSRRRWSGNVAHQVFGSEQLSSEGPDRGSPGSSSDSSGLMSGLAAMCLAILCGILVAIAAVFWRLLRRRALVRAPGLVRLPRLIGRDRDPPCLVRLSVMRC